MTFSVSLLVISVRTMSLEFVHGEKIRTLDILFDYGTKGVPKGKLIGLKRHFNGSTSKLRGILTTVNPLRSF